MAANEAIMGALHDAVALSLSELLKGTTYEETDPESGEVKVHTIPPSAAVIQAATKFLKDNNITCVPSKDNALGELEDKMKQRQEKRRASRLDLETAREQTGFLTGLPN